MTGAAKMSTDEAVDARRGHSVLTLQALDRDLGVLVRHCLLPLGLPQHQPAAPLSTNCEELLVAITPGFVKRTGATKMSMVDEVVDGRLGHSGLTLQALDRDLGVGICHCLHPLGLPQHQPAPPLPTVRYELGEPCPPKLP